MVDITCPPGNIYIGRVGENEFRRIEFDVSSWRGVSLRGTIIAVFKRPDGAVYPVSTTLSGQTLTWLVTSTDTAIAGPGEIELRLVDNGVIGKTAVMRTSTVRSLEVNGDSPSPPPPDWVATAADLQAQIGDLDDLETAAKNNLVAAINEAAQSGGGGGSAHPYLSLRRLARYLYEVTYKAIPAPVDDGGLVAGACSSYVQGGKLYRNLDWTYDNNASFHVIAPGFEGIAFAAGLTDAELDDTTLAQLPYRIVDGVNEHGIMVSTHVLYNDWGATGSGTIPLTRLPYLALTHVKSMSTLTADLAGMLDDLYVPSAMAAMEYLIQVLITDGETTYVLRPGNAEDASYEAVNITSVPKLTNFRWEPYTVVERQQLQERPTGIERWNAMPPSSIADLRFTAAYESPTRLSEFIGLRGTTKDSTDEELQSIYETAHAMYLDRTRDGSLWHTMHSVVYGSHGIEHLWIQEDWAKDYVGASSGGGSGGNFDIHGLMTEDTVADADELPFYDASTATQRKTTWGNVKNKLRAAFDSVYVTAAALGEYATKQWVQAQGFVTSLVGYATEAWVASKNYATETYVGTQVSTVQSALDVINGKIPSAATSSNQLADKNYVDSSVSNGAPNYISNAGQPFSSFAQLQSYTGTVTDHDFAFVVGSDAASNTTYTRYVFSANTNAWSSDFVLTNNSFTTTQWGAVMSGITSTLISTYNTHVNNTNVHVTSQQKSSWDGKLAASEVKIDPYDNVYRIGSHDIGAMYDDNGSVIRSTYATMAWVGNQGYLTEHQSLAAYRTAEAQNVIDAGKLNTTGDGSNVTAAFSQAGTRANIATGEKLSVLFGKIAKWLADVADHFASTGFRGIHHEISVDTSNRVTDIDAMPLSAAWGNVTGKPSFATVATSGSYNDLSNKPTIPVVPETAQATALSIDTTVTSGSSNLITSGAVYAVVGNVEAALEALL